MNFKSAADQLKQKASTLKNKRALVGFDGTVDKIVEVVEKRHGVGTSYNAVSSIAKFGEKILAASGKSTNMELFLKQQKIGGNAAIMAGALAAGGVKTTLVADLGQPRINPVFEGLSKKATLKSLGEPTETHALEFGDGKIMLCYTRNHEAINFENIQKALGGPGGLKKTFEQADLVSLVNWTMIPAMSDIFKRLLKDVLPGSKPGGFVFFDLADPEKRDINDLKEALELMGLFSKFKRVVLGLNLKEAQQVATALGLGIVGESDAEVCAGAKEIRQKLGIEMVAIHLVQTANCSTPQGEHSVVGPVVASPKIKTGAGDHFNAGLSVGLMLGVDALTALTLGVAYSGFYVETAQSPSLEDALGMIERAW